MKEYPKWLILVVMAVVFCTTTTASAKWTQGCFVDEFGDKTAKKFIKFETKGIFSNSATQDSPCGVKILVSNIGNVGIFLYEYDSNPPAYFIGDGRVLIKNSKGDLFEECSISKWSQGGGISLGINYDFLLFLKISVGEVKVAIYDEYSSQYHFTINANGFARALTTLNRGVLSKLIELQIERSNTLKEARELRRKYKLEQKRRAELGAMVCEKYVVKEGDTFEKIASDNKISIELLKDLNNYVGIPAIYPSQILLIPETKGN
jgi:hypothetical protein